MLEIKVKKQLGQLALTADLQIPSQGITGIFGLSGSGKSSLINLVSGLLNPDEGLIRLNDRVLFDSAKGICLAPNLRRVGYVFQDARLFPHYRVKGNLCYGMAHFDPQAFDKIIDLLGIRHLLNRYPLTLSGGEKQRVAIGRALLSQPDILLMDEPLSALDLPRKQELLAYLECLSAQIQIPILYVTHSLDELLRLAQSVVLLDEGKVQAYDLLETLWQSPLFSRWKKSNEQSTVLALPICQHHQGYKMTALRIADQVLWVKALTQPLETPIRVCIHSADVSLALNVPEQSSIRNILQGKIKDFQRLADRVDVEVVIGKHSLWASISQWAFDELKLQRGQDLYVQIKAVSVLV